MKFCKYCATLEELEEQEEKTGKILTDYDIIRKDNMLKINGLPFADVWLVIGKGSGNKLDLYVTSSDECMDTIARASAKINFCPMCGRRLKKGQS